MPGLIRGVARTAVVAGTATAVSNRVSRRQANRWSTRAEPAQYGEPAPTSTAPPPAARAAAPAVHVEHVESHGVSASPEVGDEVSVRAFVSLGGLAPSDVDVQLVFGSVSHDDALVDVSTTSLAPVEAYDGGRHRYEGSVTLGRTGPFGYTVRVVPKHDLLASPAELGVVALPA